MSNVDNPYGLQFSSLSKPYIGRTQQFVKLSSVNTAIFRNDVVHGSAGATGSEDTTAIEPFGTATPGTTIPLGVALDHGPSATKTRHTVIVDKDQLYHAQDNKDTDGLALADMGQRINIEANAGSSITRFSGHELDESTLHPTSYRDVLLLHLLRAPDNAFGDHARIVVKFISLKEEPLT